MPRSPTADAPTRALSGLRRPGLVIAGLAVLAATLMTVVILTDLDGYAWGEDRFVANDGRPHAVTVDGDGDAFIWTAEWETTPDCVATDGVDGPALELTRTGHGGRHAAGSIGDYVTTWEVTPTSGEVTITCAGSAVGSTLSFVVVTDAPWGPAVLAVPVIRVGVLLLALLVVPLGLVALARRRWSRPQPGRLSIFDD